MDIIFLNSHLESSFDTVVEDRGTFIVRFRYDPNFTALEVTIKPESDTFVLNFAATPRTSNLLNVAAAYTRAAEYLRNVGVNASFSEP